MKFFSTTRQTRSAFMLLVACGFICMAGQVRAEDVLAKLSQVQGGIMVKQRDGTPRIQGAGSTIAVGDTLTTPNNAFARIRFFDNTDVTLKPGTQVSIERIVAASANAGSPQVVLGLQKGSINVDATAEHNGRKVGILLRTAFGELTMQGANAVFAVMEPTPEALLASRRAYLLSSTASLDIPRLMGTLTDSPGAVMPSFQLAQLMPSPSSKSAGTLAPGLYVHVIDGLIQLSNRGGVQQFAAGQFGFTGSVIQPPVIVPNNPGIQFNPPPAFQSSSATQSNSGSSSKPKTVDCEVR